MIRTTRVPFLAGMMIILGLLSIVIGFLLCPFDRMTTDDTRVAFRKLIRISLPPLRASGSSTVVFDIPDTNQWMHIQEKWHEPRWVIAIDSGPDGGLVIGLNDAGIKVELFKGGIRIPLKATNEPPYGYSSWSRSSSFEFVANPGDELTLHITADKERYMSEGRELFIIGDWTNTKDLLVGVAISDDVCPYSRWAIALGCIAIIMSSVLLVWRKRMR